MCLWKKYYTQISFLLYFLHFSGNFCGSRDELDRRLQAEYTGEVLGRAVHPVVLLSYLTHDPHGVGYQTITDRGRVKVQMTPYLSV